MHLDADALAVAQESAPYPMNPAYVRDLIVVYLRAKEANEQRFRDDRLAERRHRNHSPDAETT